MKHQKKKMKGPKAPKECEVSNFGDSPPDGEIMWRRLLEPFASVSIDEAASAYREANGDLNRAAEILGNLGETAEDQSTTSSISSWYASSSSSELSGEDQCAQYRVLQKSKMKKVVASAGTVSTVLGKDYVSSLPKNQSSGQKKFSLESYCKEESEQFLCSMLGDDCHLSLAVVRDVLCQCGYDFYKALNILLELSSSPIEQSDKREEALLPASDLLTDRIFCSSHSSKSNIQEQMLYAGSPSRDQHKLLHEIERSSPPQGNSESQVSKDVLKSLFNVPTLKTVEHVPGTVKWRDVVTKMTSLGLNSEPSPASGVTHVHNYGTMENWERNLEKMNEETRRICEERRKLSWQRNKRRSDKSSLNKSPQESQKSQTELQSKSRTVLSGSLTKSQKESHKDSKESRTVSHSRKKSREKIGKLGEKEKRGKIEKEKRVKSTEMRTGLDEVRTKLRQHHRRGRSRTVRRCRNSKKKGSMPTSSGFMASTRAEVLPTQVSSLAGSHISSSLIPSFKEKDPEEEVNQPSEISSDNRKGSEILTDDMSYANIHNLKPLIDIVPELGLGVPMKGLNQIEGFLIDSVTPIKNIQDRLEIEFIVNWKIYTNRFLMSDHKINPAIFQFALISGEHVRKIPSICILLQGGIGLDYRFGDSAVANSYSVARSPSARSSILVTGICKEFGSSYLDCSIFQHQQQKLNVPGSFNMLTIGKEILIEVQSTSRVWESDAENASCYSLIIYPEPLVLTILSNDDLVDNFINAVLKVNPKTWSSSWSSWSYFLAKSSEVSGGYLGQNSLGWWRTYDPLETVTSLKIALGIPAYQLMGALLKENKHVFREDIWLRDSSKCLAKDEGGCKSCCLKGKEDIAEFSSGSCISIVGTAADALIARSEATENRGLALYSEARAISKWNSEQKVMNEDQYQQEQNHLNSMDALRGEDLVLFLLEVRKKIQEWKLLDQPTVMYWEGRGARKKKKKKPKIVVVSYHPP